MSERATEEHLVLQAQAGNAKAFELLYRSYHASLVRFAFRLCGNEQMACDAVQDACILIARKLGDLHTPSMFRARVFKAVRWRTTDYMRKKANHTVPLDDVAQESVATEKSMWATSSQLGTLINKLPDVEKQAIHLFYLEELKLTEIAAVLEVPTGTIKSRLNRARGRLKTLMEGEENDID